MTDPKPAAQVDIRQSQIAALRKIWDVAPYEFRPALSFAIDALEAAQREIAELRAELERRDDEDHDRAVDAAVEDRW